MEKFKSVVPQEDLTKLNAEIKKRGHVDREHLTAFLKLIPTNHALVIIDEVKHWLEDLHASEEFKMITFPQGDIDSILGDLDSYGRVMPEHIYEYKQQSNKVPPMV